VLSEIGGEVEEERRLRARCAADLILRNVNAWQWVGKLELCFFFPKEKHEVVFFYSSTNFEAVIVASPASSRLPILVSNTKNLPFK